MTFFGDDTWTRLFPDSFLRRDPTTSFYVNDFTEVDVNVSRHLDHELEADDWEVMILHYLGLDHIGHIAGPASSLVPPKLEEMSHVLEKIWTGLVKDRERDDQLPPALIVVGDHGMADGGGHGGASLPEVLVPFVLLGGGLTKEVVEIEEILQIDTTACLAFLTGVPIPAGSLGKLPQSFLSSFNLSNTEEVAALEYLASILAPTSPASKGLDQVEEARKLTWEEDDPGRAKAMYRTAIANLQVDATSSLATYDLPLLVLTTISLALLTIMAVSDHHLFHLPSLLKAAPLTLFFHIGVNCVFPSSAVSSLNKQQLAITPLLLVLVSFCIRMDRSLLKKVKSPLSGNFSSTSVFLLVSSLVHSVSLLSSSFVEEEHQTVYFLYSTFLLLLLLEQRKVKVVNTKSPRLLACMIIHRVASSLHSTGDKWRHLPGLAQWLKETNHGCTVVVILSCIVLLLLLKEGNRVPQAIKTAVVGIILVHKLADSCPVELVRLADILILLLPFTSSVPLHTRLAHSATLLTFLLHSPTHLPVLALLLLHLHLLQPTLSTLHPSVQPLVHLLLARVTFFQLGGSNSLATIDVGAGYTGLTHFNPVLVTLLMAVHTYSGALITLLSAPVNTSSLLQALPTTLGLELTTFCLVATLLRHHLFVWTVFSPKLLYLGMHLVVLTCIATVINSVKYIQR